MSIFKTIFAGGYTLPPGHELALHRHRFGQLEVVESGRYLLLTAQGPRPLSPGDAVWIAAGAPHGWRARGPVRALTFRFHHGEPWSPGNSGTGIGTGGGGGGGPVAVRTLKGDAWLSALPGRAIDAWQQDTPRARRAADHLLAALFELTALPRVGAVPPLEPQWAELIRVLRAGGPPLGVGEMAQRLHLSPTHFRRRFRGLMGESVGRYQLRMRMSHARGLLSFTSLPVHEVAAQAGYADTAAFSKAFRRWFGHAPGSVRLADAASPAATPSGAAAHL